MNRQPCCGRVWRGRISRQQTPRRSATCANLWHPSVMAPLMALALLCCGALAQKTAPESGEAQWIWRSAKQNADGPVLFRKVFFVRQPVYGQIDIAADEGYELY